MSQFVNEDIDVGGMAPWHHSAIIFYEDAHVHNVRENVELN